MKRQSELLEIPKENVAEYFSSDEIKLIDMALEARSLAYAPYSNFNVGSAVLLDDGTMLKGNNQENAAYPSGLCAERVVINFAKSNHPNKQVRSIAIVTDKEHVEANNLPIPCGACLQTMSEVENRQKEEMRIILIGNNTYYLAKGIKQFLPFQFNF